MKSFSNGVLFFTEATLTVPFPEDDVCCHWCPLMGVEVKTDREYCRRTGEYLTNPKTGVGGFCPLETKENENV